MKKLLFILFMASCAGNVNTYSFRPPKQLTEVELQRLEELKDNQNKSDAEWSEYMALSERKRQAEQGPPSYNPYLLPSLKLPQE